MFHGTEYEVVRKAAVAVLFIAAFLAGRLAAHLTSDTSPAGEAPTAERISDAADGLTGGPEGASADVTAENDSGSADGLTGGAEDARTDAIAENDLGGAEDAHADTLTENDLGTMGDAASTIAGLEQESILASTEGSWGLSFQQEGEPPVANATMEELAQYDAYYASDTDEKVIYLTFDCGYENGNTPAILEALKKHGVSATFFVVGNFVSDQPELVCQMLEEGHTVGNHTAHHPDMSAISDLESFQAEIEELETLFMEATGQEITKYYRPPQGKYSESNLAMAQELGYKTFFWSLAYVDWYQDDQPTEEEAYEKLLGRIHPGAIVLLHNTSSTNAAILDELLTKWEEMGCRFGKLEELL